MVLSIHRRELLLGGGVTVATLAGCTGNDIVPVVRAADVSWDGDVLLEVENEEGMPEDDLHVWWDEMEVTIEWEGFDDPEDLAQVIMRLWWLKEDGTEERLIRREFDDMPVEGDSGVMTLQEPGQMQPGVMDAGYFYVQEPGKTEDFEVNFRLEVIVFESNNTDRRAEDATEPTGIIRVTNASDPNGEETDDTDDVNDAPKTSVVEVEGTLRVEVG